MSSCPEKPDQEFKEYIYSQLSRVGKVLSSGPRLVIMNILCQGACSVEVLAHRANLSVANLSRHLQVLLTTGMVKARRSGKYTFYSLADDSTREFFATFVEYGAKHLDEISMALQAVSKSPSRSKTIETEDLLRLLQDDDIVLVDVRPKEEFDQGHVANAVSIPLDEIEEHLPKLSKQKPIVVYCRGKLCILADEAVELFIKNGYQATRTEDGMTEWHHKGMPVAVKCSAES